MKSLLGGTMAVWLATAAPGWAQRDLREIPDTDPEVERRSFQVPEGMEVELFASEPLIAKPVQMNWDERGRLWVVSSRLYPQISPGREADDEIVVLEDTDGDGKADLRTVFADGLLIPTGVMPGDGGAYVANSTEILFLRDTDGDGAADERRVVLSGFGTEDTHHIIHTFRGGPEGMLYFNQSIYIHSHVETPWGVRRLGGGGIWHYRPESERLDVFCKGFVNSWGHVFDRWGQSFATDGAYGEGINYVFPGSVFVSSPDASRILRGLNPGQPKQCGLEILSGRHLPESWNGSLATNDFRGHRVNRFSLSETGSGYAAKQEEDLIRTTHGAFRPIDVRMGPDGAIYIADWYNPIIQHGEVDFRDPRRDHVHGRIWRLRFRDRPLAEPPALAQAGTAELLEKLREPEDWTRHFAKRRLRELGSETVLPELRAWVESLDSAAEGFWGELLEAHWVFEGLNVFDEDVLRKLLASPDHRVRAAGVRTLYHRHRESEEAVALLGSAVRDGHPQVRLEAVNALRQLGTAEAVGLAMEALDAEVDENLDFALWLTARSLAEIWIEPYLAGHLDFGGRKDRILFALRAVEDARAVSPLLEEIRQAGAEDPEVVEMASVVAAYGTPEQLGALYTSAAAQGWPGVLMELERAAAAKRPAPSIEAEAVERLLENPDPKMATAAARLAGAWSMESLRTRLEALVSETQPAELRQAAVEGLAALGGDRSRDFFEKLTGTPGSWELRAAAAGGLIRVDVERGAAAVAAVLGEAQQREGVEELLDVVLRKGDAPAALAKALEGARIAQAAAAAALRRVETSGAPGEGLAEALQRAGDLLPMAQQLSPEAMTELLAEVRTTGDPERGEWVYRREALQCMVCHAIGGAGGVLGPDLISIGSSAPADYIVEALLDPNRAIKEGHHMTVLHLAGGDVRAGMIVREDASELVLRDATGREEHLATSQVQRREITPVSMMPPGLTASLRRDEFVDLTAFLSELGREGPFRVPARPVVRRWETAQGGAEADGIVRQLGVKAFALGDERLGWKPAYSTVGGKLPLEELDTIRGYQNEFSVLRFALEVSAPGEAALGVSNAEGLQFWVDGREQTAGPKMVFTLETGRREVTVAIDRAVRSEPLEIELLESGAGGGSARLVGGP